MSTFLEAVRNFYLGADEGPDPNPYTSYSFDIAGLFAPGGAYTLRFAEVDDQYFFNLGVDNVSIVADTFTYEGSPEPGTIAMWAVLGLMCIGARRWRRKYAPA